MLEKTWNKVKENKMNHFILKTLLVISLLCFFSLQSFAGSNPFMKLLDALHLVRDNMNSYEQVEKRLSQIVPTACQIDETKISREEMEFLLTVFKLDCAVSLKKGKESLSYAQHLEKIIADNKVDYKKLSNLFEGLDMKFLSINIS